MSFYVNKKNELEYLTSSALEGAVHCFSTRFGGVSEGALASLNLGVHRGDRPANVRENYRRLGAAVGFDPKNTVFTKQVHSDIVQRVGRQDCGRVLVFPVEEARDGLVTDEPGVALTIFSAACRLARHGCGHCCAHRGGNAARVRLPSGKSSCRHRPVHFAVLLRDGFRRPRGDACRAGRGGAERNSSDGRKILC